MFLVNFHLIVWLNRYVHLLWFPFGFGDVPRLRCKTGDRFGERFTYWRKMCEESVSFWLVKKWWWVECAKPYINHHSQHLYLTIIEPPFSFSGDGDEPPPVTDVAELRRDGVKRTVVSKCRNLKFYAKQIYELNDVCYFKLEMLPNWNIALRSIIWAGK